MQHLSSLNVERSVAVPREISNSMEIIKTSQETIKDRFEKYLSSIQHHLTC